MIQSTQQSKMLQHHSRLKAPLVIPLGLMLLAAILHLYGFTQLLPYHFDGDEQAIWLQVEHLFRTGSFQSTYSPLRILGLMLEFRVMNLVSPNGASLSVFYLTARLTTVFYTLLLLAAAYQAGKQLHSSAAGIAAMLYLLPQSTIVHYTKIFKTDTSAWFWGMITILLVFQALRSHKKSLILLSFVAGIAAFLSKYTMAPVLSLPVIAAILVLPRSQRIMIMVGTALLLVAGLIVLFHPAHILVQLMPSHAYVLNPLYERGSLFSMDGLGVTWRAVRDNLGEFYIGLFAAFVLTSLLWKTGHLTRAVITRLAILGIPMLLTYLMLVPFTIHRGQDSMLVVLCASLVWGVMLASVVRQKPMTAAVASLLLASGGLLALWKYDQGVQAYDTRKITAEWVYQNLPSGTQIALEQEYLEFVTLSDIHPESRYFIYNIDTVYEKSLEEWARSGIEYLVADSWNYDSDVGYFSYTTLDQRESFLKKVETTLDLGLPEAYGWQGSKRYIFRVPPVQDFPMHVLIGESIIFKGFDLPAREYRAGGVLPLVLYWTALSETDHDYMVFVHLYAPDGSLITQQDGPPLGIANPTYYWRAGSFEWGDWLLALPDDLSSGTYTIRIGMYDRDTLVRLPITDQDGTLLGDGLILTEVRIKAAP